MSNTANNFSNWEYQVIALAGVTQSAALVHRLAHEGEIPATDAAACINSLLVLNPASVADIYPNVSHLSLGLRCLQNIFSNERVHNHTELVRYTLGILVLRNKLMANSAMQEKLRAGLQHITPLTTFDSLETEGPDSEARQIRHEHTFQQLATLYQDTISTLSYRVQVQGKIEHLKNEQIANRVRALLLAGIRSAVLWYQMGGRRWRLIFYRKRIFDTAAAIRRKLIISV